MCSQESRLSSCWVARQADWSAARLAGLLGSVVQRAGWSTVPPRRVARWIGWSSGLLGGWVDRLGGPSLGGLLCRHIESLGRRASHLVGYLRTTFWVFFGHPVSRYPTSISRFSAVRLFRAAYSFLACMDKHQ
jgi:hypothetical protein